MKNYRKFRLHPVKRAKEYYQVCIFNNRLSMRLFAKQILNDKNHMHSEASTHSFRAYKMVDGQKVISPMIGAMLFYKGGFGHGVVAHEMAHAVNYLFLKQKIDFSIGKKHDDNWKECDETYATILGYMVNQFWKKLGDNVGKERY